MTHLEDLIKLGFLVEEDSKEAIERLNDANFQKVVKHLKEEKPFMVSKDLLKNILSREIEILKQYEPIDSFTVQDFVEILNKRYSFLQNILLSKVELKNIVSINKISNGNISVIGLVKDILIKNSKKLLVLEDPSGYLDCLVDAALIEKVVLDDVIAVTGRMSGKVLYAEKVFFPSVPLRPVNYSESGTRVAFTSKKVNADYIVSEKKIDDRIKRKTYNIKTPCFVKINDVNILIALSFEPMELLNKRYININKIDFLIDPVPDIIFTDKAVNMSYKGISIVSKNNLIELKTREIQKIT